MKKYVAAVRIGNGADEWLRQSGKKGDPDDVVRKLARNGLMHLARATAFLLNGDSDHWPDTLAALEGMLQRVSDFGAVQRCLRGGLRNP